MPTAAFEQFIPLVRAFRAQVVQTMAGSVADVLADRTIAELVKHSTNTLQVPGAFFFFLQPFWCLQPLSGDPTNEDVYLPYAWICA